VRRGEASSDASAWNRPLKEVPSWSNICVLTE
jgi:hypothetical protein